MSTRYVAVKWNANKRAYDLAAGLAVLGYLGAFVLIGQFVWGVGLPVLVLRALGSCAFLLLNVILCLGPLARFFPKLTPLVYNRRHLGVMTFLLALMHALIAVAYYHGFGRLNPFVSLLASNTQYTSLAGFPFELLGLGALAVLFLLASTSHDYWQKALSPSVWKSLHMLVYPAYGLLVLHVALGAMQVRPMLLVLLVLCVCTVGGLHLSAALREWKKTASSRPVEKTEWVDIGTVEDIPEGRAKVIALPGHERIAVFRHEGTVSAVSNVCAHQRGPIGEGKIVDGCISCPWHGWEYRPEDGCSPPPFAEKIPTYQVCFRGERLLIDPKPLPPGTPVSPARISEVRDGQ